MSIRSLSSLVTLRSVAGAAVRASPIFARSSPITFRSYSADAEPVTEDRIKAKLVQALNPSQILVVDTSGGCGSFFNIDIASKAFNGLSKVKQHKLVQNLLKDEVKDMHGLSLRTVPEEDST